MQLKGCSRADSGAGTQRNTRCWVGGTSGDWGREGWRGGWVRGGVPKEALAQAKREGSSRHEGACLAGKWLVEKPEGGGGPFVKIPLVLLKNGDFFF